MKRLLLLLLLTLIPTLSLAQTTTVTGTVADANGNAYSNGTVSAFIVLNSGQSLPAGASLSSGPFSLNLSGAFSIILFSPASYQFTICGTPVNIGPRANPVPNSACFTTVPISVFGVSIDITASLSPVPLLGPSQGNPVLFSGPPTGTCTAPQRAVNTLTGDFYSCVVGAWIKVGPGGNPGVLVSPVITPNPLQFNVDIIPKGPNPYVDVRAYGVRAVNPNVAPAINGITASISASSSSATISSASTFQNGDGVVIYGAGATQSMATPGAPTVTPSTARAMTGTFDTVPGPSGSTAYSYKIMAMNQSGGLTAASAVGTTTTGQASLGSQNVTTTVCTAVTNVLSCTTSSAHTMAVGTMFEIVTNLADNLWAGTYQVATVPDNTHITALRGQDTRNNGPTAPSSAFSATIYWFNCNHVTWSSVAGAYQYFIYNGITNSLIGVSWPANGTFSDGSLAWDDFGSTMMGNVTSFPAWVPLTAPSVATSNNLVTTIASGAGTTTLTLANAAGTTVSGATIRFDNAPNILTASSANSGRPIQFPIDPNANSYVVNSILDLTGVNSPLLVVPGGLSLNATLITKNKIIGSVSTPVSGSAGQFSFESLPNISCSAIPCVHVTNAVGFYLEAINFSGSGNGDLLLLQDGVSATGLPSIKRSYFSTGGGANDYMGIGLIVRGQTVGGAGATKIERVNFATGPGTITGGSLTPSFYCDGCTTAHADYIFFTSRGMGFRPSGSSGGNLRINWVYDQGGIMPLITVLGNPTGGQQGGSLDINHTNEDTMSEPAIAYLPSVGSFAPQVNVQVDIGPSGGVPIITGPTTGWFVQSSAILSTGQSVNSFGFTGAGAKDGIFVTGATSPGTYPNFDFNAAVLTGPAYPIFVNGAIPAAPTCVVASGGSVTVGTYTITYAPVWQNGAEGVVSLSTTCTTSTGNQTLNISWPATPGFPQGYDVAFNGNPSSGGGSTLVCGSPQTTGTSVSFTSNPFTCWTGLASIPAGGPTMLMPGAKGVVAPNVQTPQVTMFSTVFANLGTPSNGILLYCSDCTIANPCAGGGTGALAKRLNGVWVCN